MHADHSAVEIIAHGFIAFLFLFRGITSLPEFQRHAGQLRDHQVPFPAVVAAAGFATMLCVGVMVALDIFAAIGAAMLVVFTVLANFFYHDFWKMTEPRQRQTHLWIFCNNIGVMGGLLLLVAV